MIAVENSLACFLLRRSMSAGVAAAKWPQAQFPTVRRAISTAGAVAAQQRVAPPCTARVGNAFRFIAVPALARSAR